MPDTYLPPWLRNTPLADVYVEAYLESGNADTALDEVRAHPAYATYFPGNLRDDGTVRYEEGRYQSTVDAFADAILSFNVNPDLFRTQFGSLIAGEVSPIEFADRLEQTYEGVINQMGAVRQWYVDQGFAVDITDEAIFASVIDPDIGDQIIAGDIAMAQVGGQAAERGFNIAVDFARRLTQEGLDTSSEAAEFFSLAEGALPTLQTLARRHDDPDDDFDLEEFSAAQLFGDPEQRQRMRRLLAQERATFTGGPAGIGTLVRSQEGAAIGASAR